MTDLKKAYDAIKTPDWVLWLAAGLKGVFDPPKTVVINVICSGECQKKKGNKQKETSKMKYIRMHQVEAEPMTRGEHLKSKGLALIPGSGKEEDEGYKVVYPDGYVSWCPKAQFEEAGRECDGMTFGMAIEAMKRGKKVARRGWNGKGMFLWLKPSTQIKAEWCKDEMLKGLIENNGGEILGLGTICMYTHDSTERKAILTGWLASQSDMLCEDWVVVE